MRVLKVLGLLLAVTSWAAVPLAAQTTEGTSRWKVIHQGESVTISIDTETDTKDSKTGIVTAWTDWRYQRLGTLSDGKQYRNIRFLEAYDCEHRETATKQSVYYNDDGDVVLSGEGSNKFANVLPESLGENAWKGVCAYMMWPSEREAGAPPKKR